MTSVNVVVLVIVDVTESVPVTVTVYVPVGGLEKGVLVTPPQAETANPTVARRSNPTSPRNLRELRPRKPTRSNPANATVNGSGLPPVFWALTFDLPVECKVLKGLLPLAAIASPVSQSEALASSVRITDCAAALEMGIRPLPLL